MPAKPCEYCDQFLPAGVDRQSRRIRSAHFHKHAEERKAQQQSQPKELIEPPTPSEIEQYIGYRLPQASMQLLRLMWKRSLNPGDLE
jgi:hypothetical protein